MIVELDDQAYIYGIQETTFVSSNLVASNVILDIDSDITAPLIVTQRGGYDIIQFNNSDTTVFNIDNLGNVNIDGNLIVQGGFNNSGGLSNNLVPNIDSAVSLGEPNLKFKDLFLSENSLHIGDSVTLGAIGDILLVNDNITVSNIYISGSTTTLSAIGDTLLVNNNIAASNITVSGLITGTFIGTSSTDTIVANTGHIVDVRSDIISSSNINVSSTLTATTVTATNLGGTLTTAAQTNVTSLGTLTSLAVSGDLNVDTNTLYVDSTNNFVGINSGTPSQALDVVGSITLTGDISSDNALVVGTNSAVNLSFETNNSEAMSINGTTGNIVINNDLNVLGSFTLNTVNVETVIANTGHYNDVLANTVSASNVVNTGPMTVGTTSPQPLYLETNSNIRVAISDIGYVGINSNTPTVPLDIVGNSAIDGNLTVTGTIIGTISGAISGESIIVNTGEFNDVLANTVSASNVVNTGPMTVGTTSSQTLSFQTNNNEIITILGNGNVGINSTTPTVPLDIVGDTNISSTTLNITSSNNILTSETSFFTGDIVYSGKLEDDDNGDDDLQVINKNVKLSSTRVLTVDGVNNTPSGVSIEGFPTGVDGTTATTNEKKFYEKSMKWNNGNNASGGILSLGTTDVADESYWEFLGGSLKLSHYKSSTTDVFSSYVFRINENDDLELIKIFRSTDGGSVFFKRIAKFGI